MIKQNLTATIVVDKDLEMHVRTTDGGSQIVLELPLPKMPVSASDLQEAIRLCEEFAKKRKLDSMDKGPQLPPFDFVGDNPLPPRDFTTTLPLAMNKTIAVTPTATHPDEQYQHVDLMYGDDER